MLGAETRGGLKISQALGRRNSLSGGFLEWSRAMKFDVVVFTKPEEHGIATKRIKLVNGEVDSDASECRMWDGVARVKNMHDLQSFEALINSLSSQEFICLGT